MHYDRGTPAGTSRIMTERPGSQAAAQLDHDTPHSWSAYEPRSWMWAIA